MFRGAEDGIEEGFGGARGGSADGGEEAEGGELASEPRAEVALFGCEGAPEELACEHVPAVGEGEVLGGEEELVAREQFDLCGVAGSEGGAAEMVGDGGGDVDAGKAEEGASQAEVDVFEVREEALVERAGELEDLAAQEEGGEGGEGDGSGCEERRGVGCVEAGAPSATGAGEEVKGAVEE